MVKEKEYKYSVKSTIKNTWNFTLPQIQVALNSSKSKFIVDFYKSLYEKALNHKTDRTYWTENKSYEIRNLFTNNINASLNEDEITIESNYTVSLPEDWDKGTLYEWAEGINNVVSDFIMDYTDRNKVRDEHYINMMNMLSEAFKKQRTKVVPA